EKGQSRLWEGPAIGFKTLPLPSFLERQAMSCRVPDQLRSRIDRTHPPQHLFANALSVWIRIDEKKHCRERRHTRSLQAGHYQAERVDGTWPADTKAALFRLYK